MRDTGGRVRRGSSAGDGFAVEGSVVSDAPGTVAVDSAPCMRSARGPLLDSPVIACASALAAASCFVGRPRFFFGGCSICVSCPNMLGVEEGLGRMARPAVTSKGNGRLSGIGADRGDGVCVPRPGGIMLRGCSPGVLRRSCSHTCIDSLRLLPR